MKGGATLIQLELHLKKLYQTGILRVLLLRQGAGFLGRAHRLGKATGFRVRRGQRAQDERVGSTAQGIRAQRQFDRSGSVPYRILC